MRRAGAEGAAAAVLLGLACAAVLVYTVGDQMRAQRNVLLAGRRDEPFLIYHGSVLADSDGKPQLDPWPFPDQFRPSRTVTADDDGTILAGAKCRVSWWTGGPDYPDEVQGTQYFPQNPNCRSSPAAVEERTRGVEANSYGFKCFSDGKCSIFPSEDEGVKGGDGIARDGQWGENPEW